MSYILDALRRADAERGRGAVPDLNAQPLALPAVDDDARGGARSPWLWLALGATLVLAGWGAWQWLGRGDAAPGMALNPAPPPPLTSPTPPPITPLPPVAPPQAVAPTPAPQAAPAPPVAAPAPTADAAPALPPEAMAQAGPAATSSAPPVASTAPPTAAPTTAPAVPGAVAKKPARSTRASSKPAPPATAPTPAPEPAPRIPKLAELPDDVRSGVPGLAIGGSVYSPQAASRMVIVNGQVFREGDTLAAGLKLEQIKPKSAVFSIRGQAFELPY